MTITGWVYDSGSGETAGVVTDITGRSTWRATHDDVTINGYTYTVYGWRTRHNATDVIGISIA